MNPAGPTATAAFERIWASPGGLLGPLRTIDNVPIARRYMVVAFAFFLAGGVQALVLRVQLARPESAWLDPQTYNELFTMHGTTMMFLFVIPFIEALANFVVPLMLGTRDLPFPRLTALSFWTYVFGGLFLYASFWVGAVPDGGWFAYVPLTSARFSPGLNLDFWNIGLSVAEVAAMAAAAELTIAILRMRAPGMRLDRLPLFAWAMLVTAVMIVFAFTPLIVGTTMLELDRKGWTAFFNVETGGDPLLWQHLFWTFGHPEVYIMFLPAAGIVSQVVQTFCRRPVAGYLAMVLAIVAVGLLGFGLWAHHMFATGLPAITLGLVAAASMVIAIPSGVQVAVWLGTLGAGRRRWPTPLLFVGGFLALFVVGGVTGVLLAAVPFNWQAHDSYFVVAHFHYVLIGGVLFPLFAGLYYWWPKVTGRLLDDRLGRWNFWTMFVAFNVTFFPMHLVGLAGMPRRVYTYPAGLGWDGWNLLSTVGAFGLGAGALLFVSNAALSLWRGARAPADPWGGDTLEWSEPSPPAQAQFATLPVVTSRHPLWQQSSLAVSEPALAALLAPLDRGPRAWRGALVVSVLEARPLAIVHLPTRSIWPFVMAVAFVILFAGTLIDHVASIAAGGALTLVALVGWFWPTRTEALALAGVDRDSSADALPLAVAGPRSNGWWGTLVLILVLATALVTLLASYWYLGAAGRLAAAARLGWVEPVVGTALALGLIATSWLAARVARCRRVVLPAALVLGAGFLGATLTDLAGRGLTPSQSAADSIAVALVVFEGCVALVALAMLGAALAWAWLRPGDARGAAPAQNGALVAAFLGASWLLVAATVYLAPRLA